MWCLWQISSATVWFPVQFWKVGQGANRVSTFQGQKMKRGFNMLLVLLVAIFAAFLQKLEWIPTGRDLLRNYKQSLITTEEMLICSSRNGENILVPESHSCRRNTWRSPYGRWPSLEGESFLKETRTGPLRPFSTGLVQLTRWSSTTSFSLSHNSWDLSFGNWGDRPVFFSRRHTSRCAIWVVWVYILGVRWIWSGGWLWM